MPLEQVPARRVLTLSERPVIVAPARGRDLTQGVVDVDREPGLNQHVTGVPGETLAAFHYERVEGAVLGVREAGLHA